MNQQYFLQSSEWEEFQKNLGRRTWRMDGVFIVRHKTGQGTFNYLYAGRPLLPEHTEALLAEVARIAQQERSLFFRVDRTEPHDQIPAHDVLSSRARPGRALQPQRTVILDLSKPEEQLLAAMHEKTRYNIRLSEKKGVTVKKVVRRTSKEDFGIFWDLLQKTAGRDKFHTHPRRHYELLIETRSSRFSNELFFAEHEGKVIATAMINFYQSLPGAPSTATYLHGASSGEARNVMAPYALHWHIARDAKQRGYGWYDLWGIDEKKWPGLTRFKRGFGGREIAYAPTVEIIYRPFLTRLYKLAHCFR